MKSLYLIPTPIAEGSRAEAFLSLYDQIIPKIELYLVENKKSARAVLKKCNLAKPLAEVLMLQLDEKLEIDTLLKSYNYIAIMSEAGCPCIADPGSEVVLRAHALGIKVVPLIGPSSILLALMASGLNGQEFSFHGYLPIKEPERTEKIKSLLKREETHIFIETPYRVEKTIKFLINYLPKKALLSISADLAGVSEFIRTKSVAEWREENLKLEKMPTILIFQNV